MATVGSVNRVLIVGRLGGDLEARETGGRRWARLSIATSERWKDRETGEVKKRADWHTVFVSGKQLELLEEVHYFFKKGCVVMVQGRLRQESKQEPDGAWTHKTTIVPETVTALPAKKGGGDGGAQAEGGETREREPGCDDDLDNSNYSQTVEEMDDDIPF